MLSKFRSVILLKTYKRILTQKTRPIGICVADLKAFLRLSIFFQKKFPLLATSDQSYSKSPKIRKLCVKYV